MADTHFLHFDAKTFMNLQEDVNEKFQKTTKMHISFLSGLGVVG